MRVGVSFPPAAIGPVTSSDRSGGVTLAMKRTMALLGSAIFLVIAPGTLAVYVPWTFTRWRLAPPLLGFFPLRVVGVAMVAAGLPVLLDSFARFAIQGLGSPVPVAPPQHLVVTGLYRYVRNPMYVAVLLLIFGEAIFFADPRLAAYGAVVWLLFYAFVRLYEEPAPKEQFGAEYHTYKANVPRWIPRLTPWRAPQAANLI